MKLPHGVLLVLLASSTVHSATTCRLMVKSDVAGTLVLDGDTIVPLESDQLFKLDMVPGDHLVELRTQLEEVRFERVVTLHPDRHKFIRIQLARRLALGLREAASEASLRLRRQAPARWRDLQFAQGNSVVAIGPTVVESIPQGLLWTRWPLLHDASWGEAGRACRDSWLAGHSDWRLPTIEEVEALRRLAGHRLVNDSYSCWSATTSRRAEAFALRHGERQSVFLLDREAGLSALCVREVD